MVIEEFGFDLYVTKGQPSVSYLYEAAEDINLDGRPTYVYVLAEWDPSGLRIFDHIKQELIGFVGSAADLHVRRLALTPYQIEVNPLCEVQEGLEALQGTLPARTQSMGPLC